MHTFVELLAENLNLSRAFDLLAGTSLSIVLENALVSPECFSRYFVTLEYLYLCTSKVFIKENSTVRFLIFQCCNNRRSCFSVIEWQYCFKFTELDRMANLDFPKCLTVSCDVVQNIFDFSLRFILDFSESSRTGQKQIVYCECFFHFFLSLVLVPLYSEAKTLYESGSSTVSKRKRYNTEINCCSTKTQTQPVSSFFQIAHTTNAMALDTTMC